MPQPANVRADGAAQGVVRTVADSMRPAGRFDDGRDRRVVDVADLGKQVVLDLEVEPSQVPREEAVLACEVYGGLDLMRHPLALDPS